MRFLTLAALLAALTVRTPASTAQTGATGAIAGVVVDARGTALARVVVTLTDASAKEPQSTITDERGRFEFPGVPAGHYQLLAIRAGYATARGGTAPDGAASTLDLGAGQSRTDLVLRLTKGGAISGTITDDRGDPVAAAVGVLPFNATLSFETTRATAMTQSDSRGRFRLSGLSPGNYILMAQVTTMHGSLHRTDAGGDQLVTYGLSFYPTTAMPSAATPIAVTADAEVSGIDFRVVPVPVTTLTATTDSGGHVVTDVRYVFGLADDRLALPSPLPAPQGNQNLAETMVPPGRYRMIASGTEQMPSGGAGAPLWASVEIATDGLMPINVTLSLRPGATISGRLVFDGAAARPSLSGVALVPVGPLLSLGPAASWWQGRVSEETTAGTFAMRGVLPGRYVLQVGAFGAGTSAWSLLSATIGGRDVLDLPIELESGVDVTEVVLTLTDRVTEISGAIVDAGGLPVPNGKLIAFSPDSRYWWPRSRRLRTVVADASGHYAIAGLPAGEYVLAPVAIPPSGDLSSALPTLVPGGVRITLADGEKKAQDIRVRPTYGSSSPLSENRSCKYVNFPTWGADPTRNRLFCAIFVRRDPERTLR